MPDRLLRLKRRILSRAIALFALAGFLAGTTGMPVPRWVLTSKDGSQPFPCQDHRCGCAGAAQCWQQCCCFTNKQKIAWAAKQGVTPPAFVVAAAKKEQQAAIRASCCSAKQSAGCCQPKKSSAVDVAAAKSAEAANSRLEFVSAVQARRCQGQAELWLALGAVAPPPALFSFEPGIVFCGPAETVPSDLQGVLRLVGSPPPRA